MDFWNEIFPFESSEQTDSLIKTLQVYVHKNMEIHVFL